MREQAAALADAGDRLESEAAAFAAARTAVVQLRQRGLVQRRDRDLRDAPLDLADPAHRPVDAGGQLRNGHALGAAQVADLVAQAAVGQQQLRSTTQRVGEQLDAIIAEFGCNGIGGSCIFSKLL